MTPEASSMPRRRSRIRTDAPRCNRLGRRSARGGLTGKLVEIETFLPDPQVEVKHGDGDRRDGADQGGDEGGHVRDDTRVEVVAQTGYHRRNTTEEERQRRLDE